MGSLLSGRDLLPKPDGSAERGAGDDRHSSWGDGVNLMGSYPEVKKHSGGALGELWGRVLAINPANPRARPVAHKVNEIGLLSTIQILDGVV